MSLLVIMGVLIPPVTAGSSGGNIDPLMAVYGVMQDRSSGVRSNWLGYYFFSFFLHFFFFKQRERASDHTEQMNDTMIDYADIKIPSIFFRPVIKTDMETR